MKVMDSDDTFKLFKINTSDNSQNFNILLNKADLVWNDQNVKGESDNGRQKLDDLKDITCTLIKLNKSKEKERVILTCLGIIEDLENLDRMKTTNILIEETLKEKIYKIISSEIPKILENNNLKDEIEKLGEKKEKRVKKIVIQNQKGNKKVSIILAKDKDCKTEKDFEIKCSFEDLKNEFSTIKNPNPIFELKSDKTKIMKAIDDFFYLTDDHTFICKYIISKLSERVKKIVIQNQKGNKNDAFILSY
jgi:hypothetical protein